ncbi:MAG TPA: hypothetical protein DET40_02745 [Lentisphaeria bacterium]|nr:MAG: hypothetical protein A2X45_13935 [Lentisphaerae bacterium GWF2_50_93]HCE42448.1 hypothetical protein [Lentisphaeria bacterium]
MVKPININEIAKLADVSTATVSRVMNNKSIVQEDTRRKILQIAREMNYRPGFTAGRKADGVRTVGLVMPSNIGDFFYGIENEIKRMKHRLVFSTYNGSEESLRDIMQYMESVSVDGIILMAPQAEIDVKGIISDMLVPVVTFSTPSGSGCSTSIRIDNAQGAYVAVEHLIKLHKLRKIAMIKGPGRNIDSDERLGGYMNAHEKYGIHVKPNFIVEGDFTMQSGFLAFSRLVSMNEMPDAVFVANDVMAVGAYEAAKARGLVIGRDIAIIGFDDIQLSSLIRPSLTTVHVHFDELGVKALSHLIKIIEGEAGRNEIHDERISSGLIIRESCGCKIENRIL